jgi:acetolactate decarboxylase
VRSPEEAHRGLQHYPLANVPVEILGFFSTEHKAIFTHHDTFMHLHLITSDRQKMGHLDALTFGPGEVWLYLGIE